MNNKTLLLVLAALLAVFVFTNIFSRKGEGSFKPEIIEVDTSKVTSIVIRAKADSLAEATLSKENGNWSISKAGKTYPASAEAVGQLLTNLTVVKTSFIAAKSKDKWPEYELEEDKASRLTVFAGKKVLADFFVGKFSVNQEARQITSFLRLAGSPNVYAVEGMTGLALGQGSAAYRDKQAVKLEIADVQSLQVQGPDGYTVSRQNGNWLLDGTTALDSNKVNNFLLNLRTLSGEEFADSFDPAQATANLYKTMTIQGNFPEPIVVRCWRDTAWAKPFVIQSSQFPDAYFTSDTTRLYKRLFKPVSEW